ncbi:MAG: carbohydrate binding family 9 domain-containing protein [Gemmatimonadaceae bacterium]|nr:carbohydrate binding family 9 domain-containing protein [Gemmatimonadaceae bacterium]
MRGAERPGVKRAAGHFVKAVVAMPATVLALATAAAPAESQQPAPSRPGAAATADVPTARAVRADAPPAIDGRDTDAVWATAPAITAFRVFDPSEDGDPSMPTEARVAYDDRHLYVFVRMFDPRPDSIVSLLGRRDVKVPGDHVKIVIDSYHDRRTAFEFAVNPAGVKRDYSVYDDVVEDASWDAVWDVATRIDSLGWTAEFAIPLSQLRYPRADAHTFGLQVARDIGRLNERIAWPLYRRSVRGFVSQAGDLTGLVGLGSPRRLEVTPYAVTRNGARATPGGFGRRQDVTGGADLKYGITSNLTLDATVNPDFGQVEADPAQINLTAFETFLPERRPFFLEGTGMFGFGDFSQLFYSRRIGRSPQLGGLVADPYAHVPGSSTILGAAKLTGRVAGGTSLGALGAVTGRESVGTLTVEPRTAYGVVRLRRDFAGGQRDLGVLVTAVSRDVDSLTATFLRRRAVVAGVDGRTRVAQKYELGAQLAASRVTGTPGLNGSIARTQRSGVHYYHRPDAGLEYDTTRTSLVGVSTELRAEKVEGTFRYAARYLYQGAGFETNDLGYLQRADWQWGVLEASYRSTRPRAFWRTTSAYLNQWLEYTAAGIPNSNSLESGWNVQLLSGRTASVNAWATQLFPSYCDRCAFGGPAVRRSPTANVLVNLAEDSRKSVVPAFAAIYTTADDGRSSRWRVRPYVMVRSRSDLSWELGTRYERTRNNTQYVTTRGRIGADTTHYVFAHLDQHLLSFTARLNYTMSPRLSLQLYAEPFVAAGTFFALRELSDTPRAAAYDDRFRPTTLSGVPGFNAKQFRSNAVVRWEYRPGSTLYVVWQQARDQSELDPGSFEAARDYRNLFGARPDNTVLIKGSYWLSF